MSLLEAGADSGCETGLTPIQTEAITLRERGLTWSHSDGDWDEVTCQLGDASFKIVGERHDGGENFVSFRRLPNVKYQPLVEGSIEGRPLAIATFIHRLFEIQEGRAEYPEAS